MKAKASARDAEAIALWNNAYDSSQLPDQGNLWGDPPVPGAELAADIFTANSATTIIDLPCGDGRNLPPLARSTEILLAGDTSLNAMTIAERVTRAAGIREKTVFITIDAFDTGLLPDSVDGIFCWDLLGHLTDPLGALTEFGRILRPVGHIVANMWTMNDCQVTDPNIRQTGEKEFIDHFGFYCKFYDQGDLEELLRAADMTAVSVQVSSWREPPHANYRTYEHDHESLVFTVRKQAG